MCTLAARLTAGVESHQDIAFSFPFVHVKKYSDI
jgi:hypothetical protein